MHVELHPLAHEDISRIVDYYKRVGGTDLAEDFYSELLSYFDKAADSPEGYAIRERDIRRVNLERFPFHFLYRISGDHVRVLAVRHHGRRPSLGMHRR
jgi:plasmid stabilization system protein ParE